MSDRNESTRWHREAQFFDSRAVQGLQRVEPIDPRVLARYGAPSPRRRFSLEYRFRLLGNLQNRDILDAGCGEGTNSILMAKLGARVTGIDISPASIDLARRKAEVNGLAGSTRFLCSPLEAADLAPNSFDVIWGEAILHHLIPALETVLARFVEWAKPGGLVLLAEPFNLNRFLRRLRFLIPIKTPATPDERPLERPELAIIRRHLSDFHMRHFLLLGRLHRFILTDQSYEHSSRIRRAVCDGLAFIDYGILSLPWARNLGGSAVISGVAKSETDGW